MLKLVKRRGSLAALVTAGGVAVVVLAQRVADGVFGAIVGSVSYEGTGFGDILGWVWGGIATSLLFGFSMPGLSFDGVSLATQWVWVAQAAVMSFVSYSPIVVLAGVLLWIWLASHPMKHPVAGMLDEV